MFLIILTIWLKLVLFKDFCFGEFVIPEVTLEAFNPKGFRASIPAISGIQLFAFHGNVNKEIAQVEPGEFSSDVRKPDANNIWAYYNPDLALKINDELYYWIFIQHEKLGYRKDKIHWKVTELIPSDDSSCKTSKSTVIGKSIVCEKSGIFEDNFNGANINAQKWSTDKYIPGSPDFEFVSYQKNSEVCYINQNVLFIKPKAAQSEWEVRGELDLRHGCTRSLEEECYSKYEAGFIIQPVTSARLVSTVKFTYGKVEIKAKLPAGDWIYPEIYLEDVDDPNRKLIIAYTRGNNQLLSANQEDIGSRLLFGGPILQPQEPTRSTYLRSKKNSKPFTNDMHVYELNWDKDRITLKVDSVQYGEIDKSTMQEIGFADKTSVRLVLGVGVGGVNDFPNNYLSGNSPKPWLNNNRNQMKSFFSARNQWISTWKGDNSALQVEYVKIAAL